jgi:hypothetical protein
MVEEAEAETSAKKSPKRPWKRKISQAAETVEEQLPEEQSS